MLSVCVCSVLSACRVECVPCGACVVCVPCVCGLCSVCRVSRALLAGCARRVSRGEALAVRVFFVRPAANTRLLRVRPPHTVPQGTWGAARHLGAEARAPFSLQERSAAGASATRPRSRAALLGPRGPVTAFVAVSPPVFLIGARGSQVHSEGFICTTPPPPGLGCQRGLQRLHHGICLGLGVSDGGRGAFRRPGVHLGVAGPSGFRIVESGSSGTRAARIVLTHSPDGNGGEPHSVGEFLVRCCSSPRSSPAASRASLSNPSDARGRSSLSSLTFCSTSTFRIIWKFN